MVPLAQAEVGAKTNETTHVRPLLEPLDLAVHRRRKHSGQCETRERVYAVTSLDTHQAGRAELAAMMRGHGTVENSSHHIRDVTFAEDASTVHSGTAPRAMATLRNLAVGVLTTLGAHTIAKTTRAIRDEPERAPLILRITKNTGIYGP